MRMEFDLEPDTLYRWLRYVEENPAWTLQDLLTQLMRQHFDESDAVKQSIEEQERTRREEWE